MIFWNLGSLRSGAHRQPRNWIHRIRIVEVQKCAAVCKLYGSERNSHIAHAHGSLRGTEIDLQVVRRCLDQVIAKLDARGFVQRLRGL